MTKLLKFKFTKDGMITNPSNRINTDEANEFVSVNELHGVLSELINEKMRMLENYRNEDESSTDEWRKRTKAVYEGQKEELEKIKKMLY